MHGHASKSESIDQAPAKNDADGEPGVAEAVTEDDSSKSVKSDGECPHTATHVSSRNKPYMQMLVTMIMEGKSSILKLRSNVIQRYLQPCAQQVLVPTMIELVASHLAFSKNAIDC
jgi:hypothetical protein